MYGPGAFSMHHIASKEAEVNVGCTLRNLTCTFFNSKSKLSILHTLLNQGSKIGCHVGIFHSQSIGTYGNRFYYTVYTPQVL